MVCAFSAITDSTRVGAYARRWEARQEHRELDRLYARRDGVAEAHVDLQPQSRVPDARRQEYADARVAIGDLDRPSVDPVGVVRPPVIADVDLAYIDEGGRDAAGLRGKLPQEVEVPRGPVRLVEPSA